MWFIYYYSLVKISHCYPLVIYLVITWLFVCYQVTVFASLFLAVIISLWMSNEPWVLPNHLQTSHVHSSWWVEFGSEGKRLSSVSANITRRRLQRLFFVINPYFVLDLSLWFSRFIITLVKKDFFIHTCVFISSLIIILSNWVEGSSFPRICFGFKSCC